MNNKKNNVVVSTIQEKIQNNFGLDLKPGKETIEFQIRIGGPAKLMYYEP